jgi:serine/threonine protein kinase
MVERRSTIAINTVLDRRYRLDLHIARGSNGDVYRAFDLRDAQAVAIKIPRLEQLTTREARDEFFREAHLALRLSHPNIVRALAVGEGEHGPYLVTELLSGVTLASALQSARAFDSLDAATLTLPAVHALAHAHELGIVHRDFKPANVFLAMDLDGTVTPKVLDFGLARPITDLRANPTSSKSADFVASGSPTYMAPERVRFESPGDARGDVWSVGITLFELVAGCAPFEERSLVRLFARIGAEEPAALESLIPDVDKGYALIVRKCLRPNADARYESAVELSNDLARMVSLHPPRRLVLAVQRSGVMNKLERQAPETRARKARDS